MEASMDTRVDRIRLDECLIIPIGGKLDDWYGDWVHKENGYK